MGRRSQSPPLSLPPITTPPLGLPSPITTPPSTAAVPKVMEILGPPSPRSLPPCPLPMINPLSNIAKSSHNCNRRTLRKDYRRNQQKTFCAFSAGGKISVQSVRQFSRETRAPPRYISGPCAARRRDVSFSRSGRLGVVAFVLGCAKFSFAGRRKASAPCRLPRAWRSEGGLKTTEGDYSMDRNLVIFFIGQTPLAFPS